MLTFVLALSPLDVVGLFVVLGLLRLVMEAEHRYTISHNWPMAAALPLVLAIAVPGSVLGGWVALPVKVAAAAALFTMVWRHSGLQARP